MIKNKVFLLLIDILSVYLAVLLAVVFRGLIHVKAVQTSSEWISAHYIIFLPSLFFSIISLYIAGLYDAKTLYDKSKVPVLLFYAQISTVLLSVIFFYLAKTDLTPKLTLFFYIIFSTTLLFISRYLYLYFVYKLPKNTAFFIIDEGNVKKEKLIANISVGFSPFFIREMSWNNFEMESISKENFECLIFDEEDLTLQRILIIEKLKNKGVQTYSYNQYYEFIYKKVDLENFDFNSFIKNISESKETYGHFVFRRSMDLFLGVLFFFFIILYIPFVFLANLIFSRGDLFSVQDRVGLLGKRMKLFKLRTMETTDDGGLYDLKGGMMMHKLGNKVTKIGQFLRKTRLDEFTQCINVIKGEVSIIGPRADIIGVYNDMSKKINNFDLRLFVPQGLTGWAQVHMNYAPKTLEQHVERFAYELYYIKHRSIFIDISIILKTIKTLISRTGA